MSKYLLVLGHVGRLALGERRDGVRRGRELPAAEVADRLHAEGRPRVVGVRKLDALCRKARILRAATSGGYGDALAARLAAAGARAAQARRRGRPAVTPERLREMMRIVQDQRRAAALQRSPSPRKTPHKFRGSTIYPPPPQVPVPTSPGF